MKCFRIAAVDKHGWFKGLLSTSLTDIKPARRDLLKKARFLGYKTCGVMFHA